MICFGFPASVTSRSSSRFATRKMGPPALFYCPSSFLSAPMPRGCLYWQSMRVICTTGIQPPFQIPIHICGNDKLRNACKPYQCWPSGAFLSACPACHCVYVAHESALQKESISKSDFRNSGAQCLFDFETYHKQRLAQFLPRFFPAFNLMALFTPFLPRFYPVLEGKLCWGKTEGKNGVNSLYPGVKPG